MPELVGIMGHRASGVMMNRLGVLSVGPEEGRAIGDGAFAGTVLVSVVELTCQLLWR